MCEFHGHRVPKADSNGITNEGVPCTCDVMVCAPWLISNVMLLQTLLNGFNNTNPYRLIFPDELHQGLKGDVEHLISIIKTKMTNRHQKAVNDTAMSSTPFAGLRLPSDGIFTSFKFAEQLVALLKDLPPALLTLPALPLAKVLASVMCGEAHACGILLTLV